jgi:uncharacterized protein (TIGR03663 family)
VTAVREIPKSEMVATWKTRFAETDWTPWLIVGFAALLRFFLLGIKPPHFDEGINGWFVDQVMKSGFYRYDPTNYHGPLHFYILLLSQSLFGRNVWALRLPVVLVSITCVWLALKFEPFVGRNISRVAALAMAISPGFIFYGRYSIHEIWLVLFSMLFILGLLGLWKFGTPSYLWCAGMGLTGMILTKETYIIHVGCAALAIPVTWIFDRLPQLSVTKRWKNKKRSGRNDTGFPILTFGAYTIYWKSAPPVSDARPAKQSWDYVDLAMVIGTGIALIVFFYSGTFFHWSGVKGLYQAYVAWFTTGQEGHGHEKPWYYWLKLIARYEWPALVGLILCLFTAWFRNLYMRYLAIYGVGTLVAYSIVNYKTPWCIVSLLWPLFFIFGAAASTAAIRQRIFYGAIGAIAGITLGILLSYLFQAGTVREALSLKSYFGAVIDLITLTSGGDFSTRIDKAFFITVCVWTVLGGLTGVIIEASKRPNWFTEPAMKAIRNFTVYLTLLSSFGLAISLNYFRCTTDTEPYVYVQTYNDIYRLTRPVLELAKRNPTAYQMAGHIIRPSAYPLPWILGDFTHVGYYEHQNLPTPLDADFLLVQQDQIKDVEAKLKNSYFTEPLTIRPYQDTSKLYLSAERFKTIFPGRKPNFAGKGSG